MASPPWLDKPAPGRCDVCHQPLGAAPHWITKHPHGVHSACRDWTKVPFPQARQLALLRRLAKRNRELVRDIIAEGRVLAELERQWPTAASLEAYERGELVVDQIRRKLQGVVDDGVLHRL